MNKEIDVHCSVMVKDAKELIKRKTNFITYDSIDFSLFKFF